MKRQSSLIAAAGALALSSAVAAEPKMQIGHPAERRMEYGEHCGGPMGEGVINAIDVKRSKVNISHKAINAIGWGEMTMDFAVLKPIDLATFAAGDRVHFLLKAEKNKTYSVAMMCSLDADEGAHETCKVQMHNAAMKIAGDAGKTCAMDGMDHMKGMNHGDDAADDATAGEDHSGHH